MKATIMSENTATTLSDLLPPQSMQEIDSWIAKYPPTQKQSAVMAALRISQEHHGYLNEVLLDAVADYLSMPAVTVYEVATFYSMYTLKPVGQHGLNVCTNISCQLKGSKEIVQYIEQKLNIKVGQTTADKRFTLRSVECLGACIGAPMMQVDKDYHE